MSKLLDSIPAENFNVMILGLAQARRQHPFSPDHELLLWLWNKNLPKKDPVSFPTT